MGPKKASGEKGIGFKLEMDVRMHDRVYQTLCTCARAKLAPGSKSGVTVKSLAG